MTGVYDVSNIPGLNKTSPSALNPELFSTQSIVEQAEWEIQRIMSPQSVIRDNLSPIAFASCSSHLGLPDYESPPHLTTAFLGHSPMPMTSITSDYPPISDPIPTTYGYEDNLEQDVNDLIDELRPARSPSSQLDDYADVTTPGLVTPTPMKGFTSSYVSPERSPQHRSSIVRETTPEDPRGLRAITPGAKRRKTGQETVSD